MFDFKNNWQKITTFFRFQNQVIKSMPTSIRLGFFVLLLIVTVSAIMILANINNRFLVSVPKAGGILHEGLIEPPRFINPVLAFSNSDRDLVALVYSGLVRKTAAGEFIPDLADNYKISDDGATYTVTLKDNIYFHNGKKVTADDVVWTVKLVQDPILKSPQKIRWEGLTVDKIDDKTVEFKLTKSYAVFLENLTLGILSKQLFEKTPIEQISFSPYNLEAVGSGPFEINKIKKDSTGVVKEIELGSFRRFAQGAPFIKNYFFHFFTNESNLLSAIKKGEVSQAASLSANNILILKNNRYRIETAVLPRIFGLFPNQNKAEIFTDRNVLKAIRLAINKDQIVSDVLQGFGIAIDSAVPDDIIGDKLDSSNNKDEAEQILTRAGYEINKDGIREKKAKSKKEKNQKLAFAIATADTPELKKTAEFIKEDLTKIGAEVEIKVFEIGDLNQNVIRPRDYDLLLFGQVLNNPG